MPFGSQNGSQLTPSSHKLLKKGGQKRVEKWVTQRVAFSLKGLPQEDPGCHETPPPHHGGVLVSLRAQTPGPHFYIYIYIYISMFLSQVP